LEERGAAAPSLALLDLDRRHAAAAVELTQHVSLRGVELYTQQREKCVAADSPLFG
jgi:hypothetical protein